VGKLFLMVLSKLIKFSHGGLFREIGKILRNAIGEPAVIGVPMELHVDFIILMAEITVNNVGSRLKKYLSRNDLVKVKKNNLF
jgi:hypothetical protein